MQNDTTTTWHRRVFCDDSWLKDNGNCDFLLGEGIFRTVLAKDGKVKNWAWHEEKLRKDCAFLSLSVPIISLEKLLQESEAVKGKWRVKIIVSSHFLITIEPYINEIIEKRLTIFPHPIVRPSAKVKSLSYLDNQLAFNYAKNFGFDDAIITNCENTLLECSRANILWFHERVMFFVSTKLPYYEGVMQSLCIKAAKELGFMVEAIEQTMQQMPKEAILFTTNSLQGPIPIIAIDNNKFKRCPKLEFDLKQMLNSL